MSTENSAVIEKLLQAIEEVINTNAKLVAEHLFEMGELDDENIAENTELNLKDVRKALYALGDYDLATFKKVVDQDTMWVKFYWQFHPENTLSIKREQQNKLERLKQELEFESNNTFFSCPNRDVEKINYEEAMFENFICKTCGSKLVSYDNSGEIAELREKIQRVENIIDCL